MWRNGGGIGSSYPPPPLPLRKGEKKLWYVGVAFFIFVRPSSQTLFVLVLCSIKFKSKDLSNSPKYDFRGYRFASQITVLLLKNKL